MPSYFNRMISISNEIDNNIYIYFIVKIKVGTSNDLYETDACMPFKKFK
jgi:hypothetical protein